MIRTLGLGLALLWTASLAATPVFIGHPSSAPAQLTHEQVKNILLGNLSIWPQGGAIRLAVLDGGETHSEVVQKFAARSPDQFEKFWKKQVFSGKGIMPDAFKTESELVAFIAKTPGAFGYVSEGTSTPGANVIAVP